MIKVQVFLARCKRLVGLVFFFFSFQIEPQIWNPPASASYILGGGIISNGISHLTYINLMVSCGEPAAVLVVDL